MRRQIAWLVAATTSAVVLAFVIPLCLLVRAMAEDRAMAGANQEARNVGILVSSLHDDPKLGELVDAVDARSDAVTSVLTPEGGVLGAPDNEMAIDPAVQRAVAGEAFTEMTSEGARILVPVIAENGTAVVRTEVSSAQLHRGVRRAWMSIIGLGAMLLVIAVLIAARLGRRVSTPVTDLAAVAMRLQSGELDARAVPAGPPETVELGEVLNRLAERINDLLLAERAAVGDLSHRLRTPVTALRLDVESVAEPEVAERLAEHVGHLQRTIDAIVRDARRPLRHNMGSSCDASDVIGDRVAFWAALAEDQGRRLDVDLPAVPLHVPVDSTDLRDVLDVLVDNVFAHTPDDAGFAISLRHAADRAFLVVKDSGPGLPPEGSRPGPRPGSTGLGLQIVRRTVAGIGGELDVESEPGRGTTVTVSFPLDEGATHPG